MITRFAFVSNSSSTSFICEVCGETVSGYDQGHGDFDMFSCVFGHIVCLEHKIGQQEKWDTWEEEADCYTDEVPVEFCPMCQMKVFSPHDVLRFMIKELGVDLAEVKKSIRTKYKTYEEFFKDIRDVKLKTGDEL